MKIGILGTGMVGQAHAARLAELGHDVVIGTQNVEQTLARPASGTGSQSFAQWLEEHSSVRLAELTEAAAHGEIVYNVLAGHVAVDALKVLEDAIGSKVVIDIANPLDFSKGMPPSLFVSNTDSLGEQIQNALPNAKVVKTCNTCTASVQVNPKQLAGGDHHIFISGNDTQAKGTVTDILKSYGWEHIIDLGDITTARGTEMYLPLWLRLWGALESTQFNIKIVKN